MVTGFGRFDRGVVTPKEVVYDNGAWNCGGTSRDIASGGLGTRRSSPRSPHRPTGISIRLAWGSATNACANTRCLRSRREERHRSPGERDGNWPTNQWELKDFRRADGAKRSVHARVSVRARCKPRRCRWLTSLRPSSTAERCISRKSCARFAPRRQLIKAFEPEVIRQIPVTKEALKNVREGMGKVTDPGGTAYGLAIDGLKFSGKTGTAETAGGRSEHDVVHCVGAERSAETCDGRLRRPQRRLRRKRRRADRTRHSRQILQQETVTRSR